MASQKLVSFDLKAEFGFFKKPDINDIYLSYNMLHKPALLGILGAIIGLQGYQKNGEFPQYYKKLKHLQVGIQPLNSDKGNFSKDMVTYNNGTGFASGETGGNLMITEQFLIKPAYRCYLLLDLDSQDEKILYDNLKNYNAEFIPYMGKNDFSAWWENFEDYNEVKVFDFRDNYKITSIFSKTEAVSGYIAKSMSLFAPDREQTWVYFEKLPTSFDERLFQYVYEDFVFSNATFKQEMDMSANGVFYKIDNDRIVQLF
jgi:CRISPR-associated protein Cas5h